MAAPTIALNTPADAATGVSTTPALLFTGTDADSNEIEYNVQVSTLSTFLGRSVAFDGGVDGQISIADNNFDGLNTGTVELWFKTSIATSYQKFAMKDGCIDLGISSAAKFFGEIGGVGNLGEMGTNSADGVWHHGALSWDGTWLRGYLDGVYKVRVSQSGTQNNNSNTLYLGRHANGGERLNGNIDEFRISNVARYTTETSFAVQTAEFVDDANTLILWHLDDGSGTNANDSSTSNNDGTLAGGASWSTNIPFPFSKFSSNPDATFTGTGDPHPWPSGNQVTYTVQAGDILTASTTYYWRVAGIDPLGSNTYGAWSATRSFTTAAAPPAAAAPFIFQTTNNFWGS